MELTQPRTLSFQSETHKGYYYPVRLNDVYGLLIECELRPAQPTAQLDWLTDLQQTILAKLNGTTATLGETWLFSAQLPFESEELARRCCACLMGQDDDKSIEYYSLLEGCLLEGWTINKPQHVIVILYSQPETEKKIADLYPDFMRLLAYRHKIQWAYQQSRELKQLLKQAATEAESCRITLNSYTQQRFNADNFQHSLQQSWQILSRYSSSLNDFAHQIRTIETNHHNYDKCLNTIETKIDQKLPVLSRFSHHTQNKYLLQAQTDYANLSPELQSLKNMIEYIRASVAIAEEKRDRDFQRMVGTWGIGLAVGAIMASISGQLPTAQEGDWFGLCVWLMTGFTIPKAWLPFTISIMFSTISIIFSISMALLVGLGMKLWFWCSQKRGGQRTK